MMILYNIDTLSGQNTSAESKLERKDVWCVKWSEVVLFSGAPFEKKLLLHLSYLCILLIKMQMLKTYSLLFDGSDVFSSKMRFVSWSLNTTSESSGSELGSSIFKAIVLSIEIYFIFLLTIE